MEEMPSLYDSRLQSKEIQILKTALPFLAPSAQKSISMMISYFQMQKTIEFFDNPENSMQICAAETGYDNSIEMLQAIREISSPQEQTQLDSVLNVLQLIATYDVFFPS